MFANYDFIMSPLTIEEPEHLDSGLRDSDRGSGCCRRMDMARGSLPCVHRKGHNHLVHGVGTYRRLCVRRRSRYSWAYEGFPWRFTKRGQKLRKRRQCQADFRHQVRKLVCVEMLLFVKLCDILWYVVDSRKFFFYGIGPVGHDNRAFREVVLLCGWLLREISFMRMGSGD